MNRGRDQRLAIENQDHEHLLGDIFSKRLRPTHVQSEALDVCVSPPVQRGQSFFIAGQHGRE